MPWHIENDNPDCSGFAVVKDADGSVAGCHKTKDEAMAQMAALYANESGMASARPPRDVLVRDQPGDFELRERSDGPPVLVGHFSVFDQWTEIDSKFEGRFMERVAPGAFAKTITESRDRIRVTFNHGKDVLGDQVLGTPSLLEEDGVGARYEVQLFDGIPPLILDGLRKGAYGSSFRFRVTKDDFVDKPRKSAYNPEGIPERTIREAQVYEFGPVTYPAYPGATAGIRSATDDYLLTLLRGASDALPEDGAEASPHSVEESREPLPPDPVPPPAAPVRSISDAEWATYLESFA